MLIIGADNRSTPNLIGYVEIDLCINVNAAY